LGDQGIGGLILKLTLKKWRVRIWTEFTCLSTRPSVVHLWTRFNFGLEKKWGFLWTDHVLCFIAGSCFKVRY